MKKEKYCRRCNISQEDYGFEFEQSHDGEDICEQCAEEEREEESNGI